jgi:2-dehydro-3-deoxygalactonokinase
MLREGLLYPMDYLAVDSGTTNSRVWLMRDLKILDKRQVEMGVRNTAIDGNSRALMAGIRGALSELRGSSGSGVNPQFVIAAGMITSNLGLHEVQHAEAPAGIDELALKIEKRVFPEIDGIPFYFIPGVRSGSSRGTPGQVNAIDIIRGEETELLGALQELELDGPLLYIHLGSHTKFIKVDRSNRIIGGRSTLAGELLQAVRSHTILRNSLPQNFTESLDLRFLDQGWDNARAHGFFRALYLVRVLHLSSNESKECIQSFLLGSILSEEFRCLDSLLEEEPYDKFILSGLPHFQPAWRHFLGRRKYDFHTLSADQTEASFLKGLYEILKRSNQCSPP